MYIPVSAPRSSSCDIIYEHNAVKSVIVYTWIWGKLFQMSGVGSDSKYDRMGSNVASSKDRQHPDTS